MDKFERICQLHQEFSSRRTAVKIADLADQLDCSEKTIKRTINTLRDQLFAPLEYVAEYRGWRYAPDKQHKFELPGLWMTENELVSMIMLLSILERFGNGLLSQEMERTNRYVNKLLSERGFDRETINAKLKILPLAEKTLTTNTFYTASEGLFKSQRLAITYTDFNNQHSSRTISPQTLVYYRDNWYLDAWCHLRQGLRTFSIARINTVIIKPESCKTVGKKQLAQYYADSYGIFSGQAKHTAVLKFAPRIAKEIAMQNWHHEQKGYWRDQAYILEIPYRIDTELNMDIMRYLPDVEVLAPDCLKQTIKHRIQEAIKLYDC